MMAICKWLARAGLVLVCLACVAASKVPNSNDGYRQTALYNGTQNMPYTLYGVAIQWDKACRSGNTAMCMKMAEVFETGLGDQFPEPKVVQGYYKLACEQGNGTACAKGASVALSGEALRVNAELAETLALRGCEQLNHADSCAVLAQVYAYQGKASEALAMSERACTGGADEGCRVKAGRMFYDTADTASRTAAIPLFEQACTAKKAWGCSGLADAYEKGWGVTRNRARAIEYARAGCEQATGHRITACRQHGAYLTYTNVAESVSKGEQYLSTSCRAGDGIACMLMGKLGINNKPGTKVTYGEGLYYSRRGCDLGNGEACMWLGLAYGLGRSVPVYPAVAITLFDKGCRLGHSEACDMAKDLISSHPAARAERPLIDPSLTVREQLGRAIQTIEGGGNKNEAVYTVVRLMQEENEDATWIVGGWLYYGLDGVFDTSRQAEGIIAIENAARVGHVEAAIWMGMAYWYGDGVPEDRKKGENYMAYAASRGNEMAEAIYRSMLMEPERERIAREWAEAEAWANRPRSVWEMYFDAWDRALSDGTAFASMNFSTASSGRSVSSIIDESNWNQRYNYLSGSTSACPTSNPYCR